MAGEDEKLRALIDKTEAFAVDILRREAGTWPPEHLELIVTGLARAVIVMADWCRGLQKLREAEVKTAEELRKLQLLMAERHSAAPDTHWN